MSCSRLCTCLCKSIADELREPSSGLDGSQRHTGHPLSYWNMNRVRHFEGDSMNAYSESAEAAPPSETLTQTLRGVLWRSRLSERP